MRETVVYVTTMLLVAGTSMKGVTGESGHDRTDEGLFTPPQQDFWNSYQSALNFFKNRAAGNMKGLHPYFRQTQVIPSDETDFSALHIQSSDRDQLVKIFNENLIKKNSLQNNQLLKANQDKNKFLVPFDGVEDYNTDIIIDDFSRTNVTEIMDEEGLQNDDNIEENSSNQVPPNQLVPDDVDAVVASIFNVQGKNPPISNTTQNLDDLPGMNLVRISASNAHNSSAPSVTFDDTDIGNQQVIRTNNQDEETDTSFDLSEINSAIGFIDSQTPPQGGLEGADRFTDAFGSLLNKLNSLSTQDSGQVEETISEFLDSTDTSSNQYKPTTDEASALQTTAADGIDSLIDTRADIDTSNNSTTTTSSNVTIAVLRDVAVLAAVPAPVVVVPQVLQPAVQSSSSGGGGTTSVSINANRYLIGFLDLAGTVGLVGGLLALPLMIPSLIGRRRKRSLDSFNMSPDLPDVPDL